VRARAGPSEALGNVEILAHPPHLTFPSSCSRRPVGFRADHRADTLLSRLPIRLRHYRIISLSHGANSAVGTSNAAGGAGGDRID
jgi:hypothetical protein